MMGWEVVVPLAERPVKGLLAFTDFQVLKRWPLDTKKTMETIPWRSFKHIVTKCSISARRSLLVAFFTSSCTILWAIVALISTASVTLLRYWHLTWCDMASHVLNWTRWLCYIVECHVLPIHICKRSLLWPHMLQHCHNCCLYLFWYILYTYAGLLRLVLSISTCHTCITDPA